MAVLLNTLYVTTADTALLKEGETVVVRVAREQRLRVPLHHLESIVCLGPVYVSPDLMYLCLDHGVGIAFLSEHGRFRGRVEGTTQNGALLRLDQVRAHLDEKRSLVIAKSIVQGKVANQRHVLQRAARESQGDVAVRLSDAARALQMAQPERMENHDQVRGSEGEAAARYFEVFGDMVRQQHADFRWTGRHRRPPPDPLNCLLSFAYALLMNDCLSALQANGLDPAFAFLHAFRPGRPGLALDLMEHLRPLVADRLVLSLVNNQQVRPGDFRKTESGAVELTDEARKLVIGSHQERKAATIVHPLLGEEIPWGLVPHIEARLLARTLRSDMEVFPPFHPAG
jgi:CRISPR-associated protein Cas1